MVERGEKIGEEIFKRRGSSTIRQNKVVALLSVLRTLFLPLKHISRCARSIEKEVAAADTERNKTKDDGVRRRVGVFEVVTTGA